MTPRIGTQIIVLIGLVAIVGGIPTPASAQSKYLDRGTSGFGIGAGFSTGHDINGLGASIGYSVNGVADIGAGVDRLTFEDNGPDVDLSALAFSPFISLHVLKQSRELPVSLAISGAYSTTSYSSDALDDLGWDMSDSGFALGGSIYGAVPVSPTTRIIPDFGVSYATADLKIEDSYGNSVSEDVDATFFSFGTSLAFTLPSARTFTLRAGVSIDDDSNTRFGLGLGLVLPMGISG